MKKYPTVKSRIEPKCPLIGTTIGVDPQEPLQAEHCPRANPQGGRIS